MNQKLEESNWWIEIIVDGPACIYYFGDFNNYQEAEHSKNKYIQDLEREGTEIVDTRIGQYSPEELTIYLDNMFRHSKFS